MLVVLLENSASESQAPQEKQNAKMTHLLYCM